MSYDPKCEELAEAFLEDYHHSKEHAEQLAQAIQDAIESWLQEMNLLEK